VVRLVYSNRAEELVAELAARVRAQQARDGALVPVTVVVPSIGVQGHLRLGVARESGVAANIEYVRLTRFAGNVIGSASAPPGDRVADATTIGAMALTLLLDDAALAGPDLAPVRGYLAGAGDATDPMDARRVQLASRIARLFEEYTYSRGDLLTSWNAGPSLGPRYAEVETWQRRMWLAMFGPGGLAERRADGSRPRLVPLHDAVAALRPSRGSVPAQVHVFGFSHVASTFHDLFRRLGTVAEVLVYAVSPCEGFWEDTDASDPALLQLWGRPGREHVRALNELAGFDHDDRFVDPPIDDARPETRALLHELQRDILRRKSPDAVERAGADGSLVVLEHASVRRELEAVASEIWRLVESDPTLRFDDVAVVLPEPDLPRYAAQIAAVFGEAHDLPYRMSGAALASDSRVAEAVELLLGLPLGRFTRHDVLRVAMHPSVVASMDDVDPERWASWADDLGVVHGVDRTDHAETYIPRDILNWDQGLRRLALGAFMAGDASDEPRPFELGQESYVPFEVGSSDLRDAAGVGLLVRSLLADARFAREAELTMPEWSDFLRALVATYVAPDGAAEEEQLARCLRQVRALGEVDTGGARVRCRVAFDLARERVAALQSPASGEGVLVATVAAIRPLPFRVVFACGMGEGKFPSADANDALDLRAVERRSGDVSARERDKFGFLETLIGARDRLYVSYVSRDPLTGEALAPSSLVQDLLTVLGRGYVADPGALRRHHPLRRWDARYFPELFGGGLPPIAASHLPEARAEARVSALRRSLDAAGASLDAEAVLGRASTDPAWGALASLLGVVTLPDPPALAPGRVVVSISAIHKFLSFPLQGWARLRVGLEEDEDDDPLAREDEPFETPARDETMFLRQVLRASIADGCSLERAYDAAVRGRELRGEGPSGLFASGERQQHLGVLATWQREFAQLGLSLGEMQVHRFGRGGEHAPVDHVHDPLAIDVDVVGPTGVTALVRAEIGGTLSTTAGLRESVALFKRAKEYTDPWADAGREMYALRAFVEHAVVSASGLAADQPHGSVLVVATPEGPVTRQVAFAPMTADEAKGWLRGVLRDLMQETHAYFLPCEAVFVHARSSTGEPLEACIEAGRARLKRSDGSPSLRSAYGPVPRPYAYPAPSEEAATAMVTRRFGAYFARARRVDPEKMP
jgi:exodeoxyribonuclease V gamma subunit